MKTVKLKPPVKLNIIVVHSKSKTTVCIFIDTVLPQILIYFLSQISRKCRGFYDQRDYQWWTLETWSTDPFCESRFWSSSWPQVLCRLEALNALSTWLVNTIHYFWESKKAKRWQKCIKFNKIQGGCFFFDRIKKNLDEVDKFYRLNCSDLGLLDKARWTLHQFLEVTARNR